MVGPAKFWIIACFSDPDCPTLIHVIIKTKVRGLVDTSSCIEEKFVLVEVYSSALVGLWDYFLVL